MSEIKLLSCPYKKDTDIKALEEEQEIWDRTAQAGYDGILEKLEESEPDE